MKVLVTGGAGFIGSHVVDAYINDGFKVAIVDNLSTGRSVNINPLATFYEMDIRSPKLTDVFEKEKPDIVNHHAAQADVRRSVADPIFDADVNVLGSLNLIECAKAYGVKRFIYISSGGAVYGEPSYLPCDEAHPVNPICQYGVSKYIIEKYLYLYHANYGMEYTVLRYGNVYGPRQDPNGEAGVVAIFTGLMMRGKPPIINGDGQQQRDFIYVTDCASANLLAITKTASGVFNLGSGKGTTINEIFDTLKQITSYRGERVHGPAKVGETRTIYLDSSRAAQTLDWQPRLRLKEGLSRTVADFTDRAA